MKIIDERGRLFGKINVIDFLVILFLFCFIPMFYVGYKVLSKKPSPEKIIGQKFKIEMECRFIKLPPQVIKLISVGDKEYNSAGETIGEITGLGEVSPYVYELNIGADKKIIKEDSDLKQIIVKLRLNTILKDNQIYYKDEPLLVNSPLKFKTNKYETMMVPMVSIAEYKPEIIEDKYLDLNITLKELDNKILSLVAKGDKEVDEKGEVIAEILSTGEIGNSSFMLDLGNNNFVQAENAYKKQIMVKMRLKCQIRNNNQVYFKGEKIEYNSLIVFNTNKYKAKGIIAQTYEMPQPVIKERWISLQVKFTGVIPEVAKIISKGDTEKEPSGRTIGALKIIISNKASDILTLRDDKFTAIPHPFQKDVIALLDFLCIEKEGTLYFKNYPVKMGNAITFTTDLYSILGTIVGIKNE